MKTPENHSPKFMTTKTMASQKGEGRSIPSVFSILIGYEGLGSAALG